MIRFYFKPQKGKHVVKNASGHFKNENWLSTNDKTFILEKGSNATPLIKRIHSNRKTFNKLMVKYVKNGITTEDIEFNTPSAAAVFVCGEEANGLWFFRDENNKPINEYLEEAKQQSSKRLRVIKKEEKEIEKKVETKMKAIIPVKTPIKTKYIFNDEKIENTLSNGSPRIVINTKRTPEWAALEYAYEAPEYEELLLETATAININHTSLKVAQWLCDAIPEEFWNDPDLYKRKILNPFGDSGFTEKYIVTRLIKNENMIKKFPDYGQRVYHIFHNMVFSVSKTNASSLWQRKIVYGSADCTISRNSLQGDEYPAFFHGKLFSVGYDKEKLPSYHKCGNIKSPYIEGVIGENNIFDYPMLDWIKSGKDIKEYFAIIFWDVFCNEDYKSIDEERRAKIMSEIKYKLDGYFDVILGNPPYNTNDEETGKVNNTVYSHFCLAASELHPKYESFIIPSKWAYGKAKSANEFSQNILNSKYVNYFKLIDGNDAFPSADTGEISIYSKDNTKECSEFIFDDYGKIYKFKNISDITYIKKDKRYLKPIDSISEKVQKKVIKSLADDTSAITLKSGILGEKGEDILSDSNKGFKKSYLKKTLDYSLEKTDEYCIKFYLPEVLLWKKNSNGNYEKPNTEPNCIMGHIFIKKDLIKDYCGNIFDHDILVINNIYNYKCCLLDYPYNSVILKEGEISGSRTWKIASSLTTEQEVKNLQKFLKTKFVTYLIKINTVSQHFTAETIRFVPYMDFTQEWTDDKLNKYFNLTNEEIERINDNWNKFNFMSKAQLQELENELDDEEDEEINE